MPPKGVTPMSADDTPIAADESKSMNSIPREPRGSICGYRRVIGAHRRSNALISRVSNK
jgi:hypothetical protein